MPKIALLSLLLKYLSCLYYIFHIENSSINCFVKFQIVLPYMSVPNEMKQKDKNLPENSQTCKIQK